jgi:hypothetical protein
MNRGVLILCLAAVAAVPGSVCAKDKHQLEGLELQQLQSKEFENPYDTVFPAVVTILQDAGYRISSADKVSGLITGSASTKSKMNWMPFVGFGRSKKTPVVSAFVEPRGAKMSRVRFSFVMAKTKSSAYGLQTSDEEPMTDASVYQEAFEKLGKEIFVRASMDAPTPAATTPAVTAAVAPVAQPAPANMPASTPH